MDWSTHDYTRTYADTFLLPEDDHDAGIYPLDEVGPAVPGSWSRYKPSGDAVDSRIRAPIRPYGGARDGRYGHAARSRARVTPWNEYRTREGYYTGGNIISERPNYPAISDVAWDERPMHYNPNAGTDWAHLVPPYGSRPYGGGPAPSLAFPMITTSEAQVGPKDLFTAHAAGASAGAAAAHVSNEHIFQLIKIFLLVVLVVLMALTLAACGRAADRIERAVRARGEGTSPLEPPLA